MVFLLGNLGSFDCFRPVTFGRLHHTLYHFTNAGVRIFEAILKLYINPKEFTLVLGLIHLE